MRLLQTFVRSAVWFALIAGWVIAIIYAIIFWSGAAVGAFCVLGVASLIGWAALASWIFGIRRHASRHLNMSLSEATFIKKSISDSRVTDFHRTISHLFESENQAKRFGIAESYGVSLSNLATSNRNVERVKWSVQETSDVLEHYPSNAVYLLRLENRPIVVAITVPADYDAVVDEELTANRISGNALQLFARNIDDAKHALAYIVRRTSQHSLYRGQLLQVSTPSDPSIKNSIRIVKRPTIERSRIILPDGLMDTLERTVSARLTFHELLERHGHSSKTGVLLYGPPGTGKTLVAKHIIAESKEQTGIIPGDLHLETIRESFRLAAYLQPAIIVIEDVDLLAERRESNMNVNGLQLLMNEMDGLAPSCETIVLMSTNRPDVLEPALASRPGRVSQAIQFPLPDDDLRRSLFELYCSDAADVTRISFGTLIERTRGASPAFIEELVKRAILFAAERLDLSGAITAQDYRLVMLDEDFDNAIHELIIDGGEFTKGILGYQSEE